MKGAARLVLVITSCKDHEYILIIPTSRHHGQVEAKNILDGSSNDAVVEWRASHLYTTCRNDGRTLVTFVSTFGVSLCRHRSGLAVTSHNIVIGERALGWFACFKEDEWCSITWCVGLGKVGKSEFRHTAAMRT